MLSWNWRLLKKSKLHDTFLKRSLWKKNNDACKLCPKMYKMLKKGRNIEMGHLWTNHPCYSSNTSYKKVNEDVNQIITQWLVPSPVNKRKRSKEINLLKEEIYWQGKLSKRRKIGDSLSRWLQQGYNRLSFVIVVKGGEFLEVSINSKGGDCWVYSFH